jgi:outer membrane phospholipase A
MPPSRLALALLLGLAAPLTRAELVLQAPQAPVTAGEEFVLTLLVTNPAAEPASLPVPALLPLVARADTRSVSAVFHSDELRPADSAPLPAGGFRRVLLRGKLPSDFTGLVVLDATGSAAGRVAVEIAPSPTLATAPSPTPAPTAPVATGPSSEAPSPAPSATHPVAEVAPTPPPQREFGISPHEPIYFAVGANDGLNARFQLSFKFRPVGPSDDRVAGRGFWEEMYLSYTQTSLWDLHSLSKPFTDSSYRPAFFYYRHDSGVDFLGGRLGFAAGFEHESNGKGATDSRSINLLFARPTLRWGASDGWQFLASPKLYWYADKSENPDITHYRGYGDFLLALEHPKSWKLATTFRAGTSGKGSVLLDASYPFSRINDFFPLGLVHGYLHLQYFNGWGESLLHYNERADTQLRVGFMALR